MGFTFLVRVHEPGSPEKSKDEAQPRPSLQGAF